LGKHAAKREKRTRKEKKNKKKHHNFTSLLDWQAEGLSEKKRKPEMAGIETHPPSPFQPS
jgi:hypothetical protein